MFLYIFDGSLTVVAKPDWLAPNLKPFIKLPTSSYNSMSSFITITSTPERADNYYFYDLRETLPCVICLVLHIFSSSSYEGSSSF